MTMKLFEPSGGLGTPLTTETPKPMLHVVGRPFGAHVFDRIQLSEISGIALMLGFQWQQISSYVGHHWNGIPIQYAFENLPLGTGRVIKNVMDMVDCDEMLIVNSDRFVDSNLTSFVGFAKIITDSCIALRKVEDCSRDGRFTVSPNCKLLAYGEKGCKGDGLINRIIYYLRSYWLDGNRAELFSFDSVYLSLRRPGYLVYGMSFENCFIQIGTPSDLHRA